MSPILLNPGPVTLTPRVRDALAGPDLCHREPEFSDLTLRILRGLREVYADASQSYEAVLLTGSGSAAVEAMLATFASPHRPTLVVSNGVYGERMATMLSRQRKPFVTVKGDWLQPIRIEDVEAMLAQQPNVASVAVIHHETTTGRLNRLDALAALCRSRQLDLLIDGVSSFAGEQIDFGGWRPLAIAGTANKCIHGAPGVSFVVADRTRLEAGLGFAPSLYLDLETYYHAQEEGWSPFTQAVHICVALDQALAELSESGGWPARHYRYRQISSRVRDSLVSMGVSPLLAPDDTSVILSSYRLPSGDSYERVHDSLKDEGFVIYAGQSELRRTIFRIANMGAIADADVDRLIAALARVFGDRRQKA